MRKNISKLTAEVNRIAVEVGIRKPTPEEEEAQAVELTRDLLRAMTDKAPSRCTKAEREIAAAALQEINDLIIRARAKIAVIRGEGKTQDITW